MGSFLSRLTLKIFDGYYDETLERMFRVTLFLAVLVFTAAFLLMYQFGYFQYFSDVLKPVPCIVMPVFPY